MISLVCLILIVIFALRSQWIALGVTALVWIVLVPHFHSTLFYVPYFTPHYVYPHYYMPYRY